MARTVANWMRHATFVGVVVVLLACDASSCFIRNCPLGGKRSGVDRPTLTQRHSSVPNCERCGFLKTGQCINGDTCCDSAGCRPVRMKSECLQTREAPIPCQLRGRPCGDNGQGACVTDGICCMLEYCMKESSCTYRGGFLGRLKRTVLEAAQDSANV